MVEIAVLGPGGVGGLVASALSRAGEDVRVVAREPTAERIADEGISVTSVRLGDFHAHPGAVAELLEPVGALVVATKATGLQEALGRVRASPAVVVPLRNGLEHMGILRERFGADRVAAGSIRVESARSPAGQIVQSSPFLRVEIAAENPVLHPLVSRFAQRLDAAGIPTRIADSEANVLWSKLVRLNALACTTSASGRPIGFVRSDPLWRGALVGCIGETARVAAAEGAQADAAAQLADLDAAHPELDSSMHRDILAGREPELDAIAGAVLRAGRRHGIDCPTIARLADQIAAAAGIAPPRL